MADHCSVKALLLLAGIFVLAGCQNGTSSPPRMTTNPVTGQSASSSPPRMTTNPVRGQSASSSPPRMTTKATSATPEPPQCSYNATYSKSVLEIDFNRPGNYSITVFEKDRPETKEYIQVPSSPKWKKDHLKPCTEYSHRVSFINDDGNETFCNIRENGTSKMSEDDVNETACMPEYVCYKSDWDLSSSIKPPDNLPVIQCRKNKTTFCVRPANKHICSDLTISFTSKDCVNFSFIKHKTITLDFLNTSEIRQIPSTGLPAKIEATFPELPKCAILSHDHMITLTVNYTCSEKGNSNVKKELSELEPFTDYSCTGLILNNNTFINKTTPAVPFRVDCDLTLNYIKKNPSNISIELSWKTTSKNCKDVLQNFSYDCICQRNDHKADRTHKVTGRKLRPDGGTCNIIGLDPFIEYTCQVKPKYNNESRDATGTEVKLLTKPGIPDAVSDLTLSVQDDYSITVSWSTPKAFKGPLMKYKVRLYKAGDQQQEAETKERKYEFKDLSYSTTYHVEVVAFNGYYDSIPETKHIDTYYNDKAVIGFLVFITTALALLFIIYKIYIKKLRKSRNDVNEDMALEPIYVNARPPGWRHKEAH